MTPEKPVPRLAWISAFLFSFAMAGLVVVAFLAIGPSSLTTFVLPPLLAAVAALVFALKWPSGGWRWGLLLSSGFWVFFLVVFLAYLTTRQLDGISLARAISAIIAGLAGSGVASWLLRGRAADARVT